MNYHGFVFMLVWHLPLALAAQQVSLEPQVDLSPLVNESSGLIYLSNRIITHNDSGGKPELYEIDLTTGEISRSIVIDNAGNIDWEDLCFDQQYIYIGDFGNNRGSRTDLRIYRLSIADYLQGGNNVPAEVIEFSFADQTNFTPNQQTNFDAEALISYQDSLYIFTKNWGDFETNIYSVAKVPGSYQIKRIDGFNSQGLITGGTFNPLTDEVLLTGYTLSQSFIIRLKEFSGNMFSNGQVERIPLQVQGSFQIESITSINEKEYYLTSEENALGSARLLLLNTDFVTSTEPAVDLDLRFYPNPTNKLLKFQLRGHIGRVTLELYDSKGLELWREDKNLSDPNELIEINLSTVPNGHYLLRIETGLGEVSRRILINK